MTIYPLDASMVEDVVALSLPAWEPVFGSMEQAMLPAVYRAFFGDDWRAAQRRASRGGLRRSRRRRPRGLLGGARAGFVALSLHRDDRMGEIHMIAVDPDFQRRGVAARLTSHALDRFRQAGMSIAMVETGADPSRAPAQSACETRT